MKLVLGMEVGLSPAGWMKTPLGTQVDIGAGHIVLDGFPALRERGTPPLLGACLLWPRSPISATAELLLTLCVSRRRRKMYCGHARLCVCLSAAVRPHYCTDPDVTWGVVEDAPL